VFLGVASNNHAEGVEKISVKKGKRGSPVGLGAH